MAIFPLGVLGGVIAVLSLDTVGSFASQRWTFPYTRLAPISCLLWATAAAIASRAGHPDLIKSIGLGALAGFIVGLVDSTLGWSIFLATGRRTIATPARYKRQDRTDHFQGYDHSSRHRSGRSFA